MQKKMLDYVEIWATSKANAYRLDLSDAQDGS